MYKDSLRIRTITSFITLHSCDFSESERDANDTDDEDTTTTTTSASVTVPVVNEIIQCAATFLHAARQRFHDCGYTVQTIRIATNPFGEWLLCDTNDVATTTTTTATGTSSSSSSSCVDSIEQQQEQQQQSKFITMNRRLRILNSALLAHNIDFCSLGPATTLSQVRECIVPIILSSDRFSVSASIAANDVSMANQCATTIQQIAHQTKDGLGNFRFCVAAAATEYIPFFPVAKAAAVETTDVVHSNHSQHPKIMPAPAVYRFSIGLENGVLVNQLLRQCKSITNIPTLFASGMIDALTPIQQLCEQLVVVHNSSNVVGDNTNNNNNESIQKFVFVGIDTSLNPSLDAGGSIAAAMESLDEVTTFGQAGTLAVAATMTQTLQSLPGIKHCGYSGIMLPVCEDQRLSELTQPQQQSTITTVDKNGNTATLATLRISDLLSISQVCGVGIDTVPIPGDCSIDELTSVLLDVAGLAHRWNKSLSCRVFPVPGKTVGERTNFDSPYMVNAHILSLSP